MEVIALEFDRVLWFKSSPKIDKCGIGCSTVTLRWCYLGPRLLFPHLFSEAFDEENAGKAIGRNCFTD